MKKLTSTEIGTRNRVVVIVPDDVVQKHLELVLWEKFGKVWGNG
jgi:hypothetical protein